MKDYSPPPPMLDDAIATFNRGDYFAAAEMFELAARTADNDLKTLVTALNRIAAALHLRFERGGRQSSINLLSQAMLSLDDMKPTRGGIDVERLCAELAAYTEEIRSSPAHRARRPQAPRPNLPGTPPRPENQPALKRSRFGNRAHAVCIKSSKCVQSVYCDEGR